MSDDAARTTARDFASTRVQKCGGDEVPLLIFPPGEMVMFDPEQHAAPARPNQGLPAPLPLFLAARAHPGLVFIPREEDCLALWDRYAMPDHIRGHSRQVANLARGLALLAVERGFAVSPEAVYAAGLLHDLGKIYCVEHGGSHAQLGASWAMRETRNGPIAQSILFHVHWPWELYTDDDRLFITMAIIYSDKRVTHETYVSLDDRFDDLQERYGKTPWARERIEESRAQGKLVEAAFSRRLGVALHEYIADSRGLVKRA